jgi:hypothetical protein
MLLDLGQQFSGASGDTHNVQSHALVGYMIERDQNHIDRTLCVKSTYNESPANEGAEQDTQWLED